MNSIRSNSLSLLVLSTVALAGQPSEVWAQTSGGVPTQTTVTNPGQVGVRPTTTTTTMPTSLPPGVMGGSSAGGASESGNSARNMQIIGATASGAMAVYLLRPCAKQNYVACGMSAMSAVQAVMTAGNAMSSKRSSDALKFGNGTIDTDATSGTGGGAAAVDDLNPEGSGGDKAKDSTVSLTSNSQAGKIIKDSQAVLDKLKGMGVTVSPDGKSVRLPNGKTVASASFSSADGLKAAGFSDGEIDGAQASLKAAQAAAQSKIKGVTMAADGGGGGGGGIGSGSGGGAGAGGGGFNFNPKFPWDQKGRKPAGASLSGMTKQFGGEKIGVSGDDIFEMIKRRYQSRDHANQFLKD